MVYLEQTNTDSTPSDYSCNCEADAALIILACFACLDENKTLIKRGRK